MRTLVNAREKLIRAALQAMSAERLAEGDPGHAAQLEYANEQLALAARELTRATDRLLPDRQPVGWRPKVASECCDGTGYADYAPVPCPNPDCPVLRQIGTPS